MARRLYLGRLPPDVRSEDVSKLFDGYGKVVDCRVMTGFGFVEFESSRDAEDALQQFNGKSFMGNNIVVEFAKESRPRREREPYDAPDRQPRGAPRGRRPPGIRLVVDGISRDTSWQDLKDFGREAGSVSFADVDRDNIGQGVLEYPSREDAEHAVKILDGKDLRGQPVRVSISEDRNGPDNFRRDRHREDRYRDDRYGGDRYRDAPRRGRSSSPVPRSRDDKARSPPPRRDYEDRRGPDSYDRRRDDRRRDDRDTRYDDRSSRPAANGEGGWSR